MKILQWLGCQLWRHDWIFEWTPGVDRCIQCGKTRVAA